MSKKTIIIIICIILILIVVGVWKSSNNEENVATNDINDISDENISEDEETSNKIEEDETTTTNSSSTSQTNTSQTNSNQTETNQETNQETDEDNSTKTVVSEVSPIGFMGSSLYKVVLYSDGEVYVRRYDGAGTDEENIVANDIIAKNATSIEVVEDEEDDRYGEIIVKGGEVVDTDFGWIEFE